MLRGARGCGVSGVSWVFLEEGVWTEWDEDFDGSSPKEGQRSGRDGLTAPTDVVPKAVGRALNSWPQKAHWCPCGFTSFLPGIDQPCQMKLLLLNTSSTRRSEERRELQKDCAILNADRPPLEQALASAIPPIQRWCGVLPSGEELKGVSSLKYSISCASPFAQGAGKLFKKPLPRENR